ncbi:hypothetical protein G6F56_009877 [Rhizopus delemar]|nr:hypothetical protein G6F56_009877 [Rhizopus delemar]
MAELHQKRLVKALEHIRLENRLSVARTFLNLHWISQEQFQVYLPARSDSDPRVTSITATTTSTTVTDTDTIMESDMPDIPDITSALKSLNDSSHPSGAGEPGQRQ